MDSSQLLSEKVSQTFPDATGDFWETLSAKIGIPFSGESVVFIFEDAEALEAYIEGIVEVAGVNPRRYGFFPLGKSSVTFSMFVKIKNNVTTQDGNSGILWRYAFEKKIEYSFFRRKTTVVSCRQNISSMVASIDSN